MNRDHIVVCAPILLAPESVFVGPPVGADAFDLAINAAPLVTGPQVQKAALLLSRRLTSVPPSSFFNETNCAPAASRGEHAGGDARIGRDPRTRAAARL